MNKTDHVCRALWSLFVKCLKYFSIFPFDLSRLGRNRPCKCSGVESTGLYLGILGWVLLKKKSYLTNLKHMCYVSHKTNAEFCARMHFVWTPNFQYLFFRCQV